VSWRSLLLPWTPLFLSIHIPSKNYNNSIWYHTIHRDYNFTIPLFLNWQAVRIRFFQIFQLDFWFYTFTFHFLIRPGLQTDWNFYIIHHERFELTKIGFLKFYEQNKKVKHWTWFKKKEGTFWEGSSHPHFPYSSSSSNGCDFDLYLFHFQLWSHTFLKTLFPLLLRYLAVACVLKPPYLWNFIPFYKQNKKTNSNRLCTTLWYC
jgi:hypothetical protein